MQCQQDLLIRKSISNGDPISNGPLLGEVIDSLAVEDGLVADLPGVDELQDRNEVFSADVR